MGVGRPFLANHLSHLPSSHETPFSSHTFQSQALPSSSSSPAEMKNGDPKPSHVFPPLPPMPESQGSMDSFRHTQQHFQTNQASQSQQHLNHQANHPRTLESFGGGGQVGRGFSQFPDPTVSSGCGCCGCSGGGCGPGGHDRWGQPSVQFCQGHTSLPSGGIAQATPFQMSSQVPSMQANMPFNCAPPHSSHMSFNLGMQGNVSHMPPTQMNLQMQAPTQTFQHTPVSPQPLQPLQGQLQAPLNQPNQPNQPWPSTVPSGRPQQRSRSPRSKADLRSVSQCGGELVWKKQCAVCYIRLYKAGLRYLLWFEVSISIFPSMQYATVLQSKDHDW